MHSLPLFAQFEHVFPVVLAPGGRARSHRTLRFLQARQARVLVSLVPVVESVVSSECVVVADDEGVALVRISDIMSEWRQAQEEKGRASCALTP